MSHKFESLLPGDIPLVSNGYYIDRHDICVTCSLEVINYRDEINYDFFKFKGKDIYSHISFARLKDLPLTCEEFVIKNLLE